MVFLFFHQCVQNINVWDLKYTTAAAQFENIFAVQHWRQPAFDLRGIKILDNLVHYSLQSMNVHLFYGWN